MTKVYETPVYEVEVDGLPIQRPVEADELPYVFAVWQGAADLRVRRLAPASHAEMFLPASAETPRFPPVPAADVKLPPRYRITLTVEPLGEQGEPWMGATAMRATALRRSRLEAALMVTKLAQGAVADFVRGVDLRPPR